MNYEAWYERRLSVYCHRTQNSYALAKLQDFEISSESLRIV